MKTSLSFPFPSGRRESVSYSEMLESMMEAILTNDPTRSMHLFKAKEGFPLTEQLAIYSDAYLMRLQSVLRDTYPALQHYLDTAQFDVLAEQFIRAHPSCSYNIDHYPLAFAEYVTKVCDTIAQELAQLEYAVAYAYSAPESSPISPDWAATQTEKSFSAACFQPVASLQLLAFTCSVNGYALQLKMGEKPEPVTVSPNWLMVYRHKHQVQRVALSEGEYSLLMLMDGITPLRAALEDERFASFSEEALINGEFMQWFTRWTQRGCIRQPCPTRP